MILSKAMLISFKIKKNLNTFLQFIIVVWGFTIIVVMMKKMAMRMINKVYEGDDHICGDV